MFSFFSSGGLNIPGLVSDPPDGAIVEGSFTAGSPFDSTNPNGIPHAINGALTIRAYQGEYVNIGGPLELHQLAVLSADGGRLNPALNVSRAVDRTVTEQIQPALAVSSFAFNSGPDADPSEQLAVFQSDLSIAVVNAAGMLGESGKAPPTIPASITGTLSTATLAQLISVVTKILVALDAKGTVVNNTT